MARKFSDPKLVVASHNQGKVREIGDLLAPCEIEVLSAADLGLPEPEETGTSFEANARLKAHAAAGRAGLPALADDSGLAVEALSGEPGIHSARWAGPERDFAAAMAEVEAALQARGAKEPDQRRAAFVAALSLAWPDGHDETFLGRVEGSLVWPGRGERGFGYDPVFLPDGCDQTFGEMEPAQKHTISHRARAFDALVQACFGS
jgi:XTP/dITP diphosphohydrolase